MPWNNLPLARLASVCTYATSYSRNDLPARARTQACPWPRARKHATNKQHPNDEFLEIKRANISKCMSKCISITKHPSGIFAHFWKLFLYATTRPTRASLWPMSGAVANSISLFSSRVRDHWPCMTRLVHASYALLRGSRVYTTNWFSIGGHCNVSLISRQVFLSIVLKISDTK